MSLLSHPLSRSALEGRRPFVGPSGPKRRPLKDRFWSKVQKTDGCWEWTGSRRPKGYGVFAVNGARRESAHRVAYALFIGPISAGFFVCHRCDNPRCVRPDHLFLGTQADNMRDMHAKGRHRANSSKGTT